MPHNPSTDFIEEKNKEENAPINLYRLDLTSAPALESEDLFIAEYDANVAFFKDDDVTGGYSAQTYIKGAIKKDDITENIEGRIDSAKVTIGNANRVIQIYLESHDGLRGRKVTIWQVFTNLLADPNAYLEYVYYIDSVAVTEVAATFILTSPLDVLSIQLPWRKYNRDFCYCIYKGLGCWPYIGGVFVQPPAFIIGDPDSCNKAKVDCTRHVNLPRMGCFPGVPSKRVF